MKIRSLFWLCGLSLSVMVALNALPGCSGTKSEQPKADDSAAKPAPAPVVPPVEPGLDIGDVEAGVVISATVPPEAISNQVIGGPMRKGIDHAILAVM